MKSIVDYLDTIARLNTGQICPMYPSPNSSEDALNESWNTVYLELNFYPQCHEVMILFCFVCFIEWLHLDPFDSNSWTPKQYDMIAYFKRWAS